MGIHRHPHWIREGRLVLADIHFMPHILPEQARIKHAPSKVSPVTNVEKLRSILRHVHLLIRETLVRSVLQPSLEDEQVP